MKHPIFAVLLSLFTVNACAEPEPIQRISFPIANIQIADIKRQVQLADTPELRERGLMFQQSAEPGMLLLYPEPRFISLWMRNTDLALDVAFIDPQWRIIAIKPLHPLDETPVSTPAAALAALEMPRGWFAKHNIEVGHTLTVIR
ncbi:DUF192 domain-containing protein [Arsukibacterium sp. UBA3155]|uniref:DUF192 domain-containing protein n=1 Tax=Arsukibacterium sp. UBA3155 TaxID=1946058 RepID=UPI0025B9E5DC|nr:DUF192 domain-containing protein [Arsukibacterium sp. UBA3155]|tara:strand:- start:28439 stop:28873 length:435 start_codon:yes stop_codon:yes gene_type:complete